ncbi:MAG: amidohydrolase family protein [Candidatus Binataceae bacterium]|nr:amidohydrolase family protein [Candidatus Binataceae bacterium]
MAAAISSRQQSKSAQVRAHLKHPIIDSDGHTYEFLPVILDYIKAVAGESVAKRFMTASHDTFQDPRWRFFSMEERRERRAMRPTWRGLPARNTVDLATAVMPGLMYDRLDEMGLDYSVVYPTLAFLAIEVADEEVRRAACRAINNMRADMFREFGDRLTTPATIPMHTPAEAIAELEHCVKELGLKSAMMASYVRRPIPVAEKQFPGVSRWAYWLDTFGLDSVHDYDPFWAKCVELGISPTFHSVGYGWGSRQSITNYVHNHLGNFAASAEAICRSLLLGGVPKRFPKLTFAFLEGGIPWARNLFCDMISHWHKRNGAAVEHYNPALIDKSKFLELAARYGGRTTEGRADSLLGRLIESLEIGEDRSLIDEWAPSGIHSAEEIRDIFVNQFYFGCEGDDPLNAMAFKPQGTPLNMRLNALYGSDIGHWDVPDMSEVAEEVYELVEHELISEDELREFVFVNAVKFWTSTNPDFFKGTVVESEVNKLVANGLK